jgi:hypothetical protein
MGIARSSHTSCTHDFPNIITQPSQSNGKPRRELVQLLAASNLLFCRPIEIYVRPQHATITFKKPCTFLHERWLSVTQSGGDFWTTIPSSSSSGFLSHVGLSGHGSVGLEPCGDLLVPILPLHHLVLGRFLRTFRFNIMCSLEDFRIRNAATAL